MKYFSAITVPLSLVILTGCNPDEENTSSSESSTASSSTANSSVRSSSTATSSSSSSSAHDLTYTNKIIGDHIISEASPFAVTPQNEFPLFEELPNFLKFGKDNAHTEFMTNAEILGFDRHQFEMLYQVMLHGLRSIVTRLNFYLIGDANDNVTEPQYPIGIEVKILFNSASFIDEYQFIINQTVIFPDCTSEISDCAVDINIHISLSYDLLLGGGFGVSGINTQPTLYSLSPSNIDITELRLNNSKASLEFLSTPEPEIYLSEFEHYHYSIEGANNLAPATSKDVMGITFDLEGIYTQRLSEISNERISIQASLRGKTPLLELNADYTTQPGFMRTELIDADLQMDMSAKLVDED